MTDPTSYPCCQVEDCQKPVKNRSRMCSMHAARWYRHGDTTTVKRNERRQTVSYRAAHSRIVRDRGKATEHPCAECGDPAKQWAYNKQDPNQFIGLAADGITMCAYSGDPAYYDPLCTMCHARRDHYVVKERSR